MQDYFAYLREMIIAFFQNVGDWFKRRWYDPFAVWGDYFDRYHYLFNNHYENFGFWGWFFYVFFWLLLIGLIGGLLFLLFLLIRKYVKFYKKEVDKEKLQKEVEQLQIELYNSEMANRRILNLSLESVSGKSVGEQEEKGEEKRPGDDKLRFPRLVGVDRKYADPSAGLILMEDADKNATLKDVCERFRNFAASQMHLYYTPETIRILFASMATSKLIILEGISGTGKTSMPYALGRFFKNPATIVSVQPSWHDRSELVGYYNDFTKRFTETEFLRAVYESGYRGDPQLIVLDEMNLARIEYYFAEFLSVMEMPNPTQWNIDLIASSLPSDPAHIVDGKLHIEQNIWFIGTANNDDSTFTITDKVYDRAMPIELNERADAFTCDPQPSCRITSAHLQAMFAKAKQEHPISEATLTKLDKLDGYLQTRFKLAFGNRIIKQMYDFIPVYVACGGKELDGMDYIVARKVLKKLESLNVTFVRDEIRGLIEYIEKVFGKSNMTDSKAYLTRIQNLY